MRNVVVFIGWVSLIFWWTVLVAVVVNALCGGLERLWGGRRRKRRMFAAGRIRPTMHVDRIDARAKPPASQAAGHQMWACAMYLTCVSDSGRPVESEIVALI